MLIRGQDCAHLSVMVTILGIRALHLTHPRCTHTHTHSSEHTCGCSGQPFMLQRPGNSWGFGELAQGHLSHGIEGGEGAGYSLPAPTI